MLCFEVSHRNRTVLLAQAAITNGPFICLQPSPPYKIEPGTKIRVESVYDGSEKRLGIVSALFSFVTRIVGSLLPGHDLGI